MKKEQINFDSTDLRGMIKLMDKYGETSDTAFFGETEEGEEMLLSISKDKIVTRVYQANNWIRVNTYWRDGTIEEMFEK